MPKTGHNFINVEEGATVGATVMSPQMLGDVEHSFTLLTVKDLFCNVLTKCKILHFQRNVVSAVFVQYVLHFSVSFSTNF